MAIFSPTILRRKIGFGKPEFEQDLETWIYCNHWTYMYNKGTGYWSFIADRPSIPITAFSRSNCYINRTTFGAFRKNCRFGWLVPFFDFFRLLRLSRRVFNTTTKGSFELLQPPTYGGGYAEEKDT